MLDIQDSTEAAATYDVRILVVDDDALARFILADQLDALGCRCVDTAADGTQALRLALSCLYDLVITDLCMPHMGGQALLAALRAHGQAMPVIAGTAWREPGTTSSPDASSGVSPPGTTPRDSAAPDGFAAVLQKPVAMAQLRALLDAHIGRVPLGRPRRAAAGSRRALHAAFSAAWADDEPALRAALASLDAASMLERLHRLHGALAVLGEARARRACARLQQQVRRQGVARSAKCIERFLRQCARMACRPPGVRT
jgi:two-component system capsular synthesis sensor histidine kinase RcsC